MTLENLQVMVTKIRTLFSHFTGQWSIATAFARFVQNLASQRIPQSQLPTL